MKKIRLNVADFGATEILSREKLKSVFGGSGSGTTYYGWDCWCSNSTKGSLVGGSWTFSWATEDQAKASIPENCKSPLTGQCTMQTNN